MTIWRRKCIRRGECVREWRMKASKSYIRTEKQEIINEQHYDLNADV